MFGCVVSCSDFAEIEFEKLILISETAISVSSTPKMVENSIVAQSTVRDYRISSNSFCGNYSFLNLTLCTGAETFQGRKLFLEIRYVNITC